MAEWALLVSSLRHNNRADSRPKHDMMEFACSDRELCAVS
jgi:hypothetical protein